MTRFLSKRLKIFQIRILQRHYADAANDALKNVYISTPIFYVNAAPHIGHLYSAALADCIARYRSMLGHTTFLSTGTDEHGNKVKTAANLAKIPIPDYCIQVSKQFKEMCDKFSINYSTFIRTTEQRHFDAVHHFWNVLDTKGYIYLGKYSGWYCTSDEAFLTNIELNEITDASGKQIKVSKESGHSVEWMEEDNYKFRLSNLKDELKYWIKKDTTVQPAKYHKILYKWIEEDISLDDLSISRPVTRVPWSIPTPQNKNQSIYVWLEALVNYLTVLGYPDDTYKQFWPPSLQVIGKDILKFHGIYWPAFLIAAGLEPPRTLLCHGHWIVDDKKMSKSIGNVISPFEAAANFTEEGLRYFILREAVPHSNANYSNNKILRTINAELADTLGNLISRCTGNIINPWGEVPNPMEFIDVLKSDIAIKTIQSINYLSKNAQSHYKNYNLHNVVDVTMNVLQMANKMVEYHKPWVLSKNLDNQNSFMELKAVISIALESIRISALVLYPIIPRLANNILDFLSIPKENRTWYDTISQYEKKSSSDKRYFDRNGMILFKRIKAS
ncbi:PREDICTED: methionine--tRNA ligase, mitochondrial isoform X1 [Polistes canadensis]|uniref:methionine--tRNA ligase, mitochondrial isoform X1 n=2 Tax=Polistes canadensis TaxID=91411 RepID=UPI000718EBEC|nr:PREDICTED: methionine--tRNA ligase, mitochondrial isoform X1 [Polistes canadensis]